MLSIGLMESFSSVGSPPSVIGFTAVNTQRSGGERKMATRRQKDLPTTEGADKEILSSNGTGFVDDFGQ